MEKINLTKDGMYVRIFYKRMNEMYCHSVAFFSFSITTFLRLVRSVAKKKKQKKNTKLKYFKIQQKARGMTFFAPSRKKNT